MILIGWSGISNLAQDFPHGGSGQPMQAAAERRAFAVFLAEVIAVDAITRFCSILAPKRAVQEIAIGAGIAAPEDISVRFDLKEKPAGSASQAIIVGSPVEHAVVAEHVDGWAFVTVLQCWCIEGARRFIIMPESPSLG